MAHRPFHAFDAACQVQSKMPRDGPKRLIVTTQLCKSLAGVHGDICMMGIRCPPLPREVEERGAPFTHHTAAAPLQHRLAPSSLMAHLLCDSLGWPQTSRSMSNSGVPASVFPFRELNEGKENRVGVEERRPVGRLKQVTPLSLLSWVTTSVSLTDGLALLINERVGLNIVHPHSKFYLSSFDN